MYIYNVETMTFLACYIEKRKIYIEGSFMNS